MADTPKHVSTSPFPGTTGLPETPVGLAKVYDPIISGAHATAGELASLAATAAYHSRQRDIVEQTTAAAGVLEIVDQRLRDGAVKARDPILSEPLFDDQGNVIANTGELNPNFQPRQRAAEYREGAKKLVEDATARGAKIGPYGAKYIATHLRTIVGGHVTNFDVEMNKVWKDQYQFNTTHEVEVLKRRAVNEDRSKLHPRMDPYEFLKPYFAQLDEKLALWVSAGIYTEAEARKVRVDFRDEVNFERSAKAISKDPGKYLNSIEGKTATDFHMSTAVFEKLQTHAETELRLQWARDGQTETQRTRLQKRVEDQNAIDINAQIQRGLVGEGGIRSLAELNKFSRTNLLAKDDYNFAKALIEQPANIKSDGVLLTQLYIKASSFNPGDFPKKADIETYVKDLRLAAHDAGPLLNHITAREDYWRTHQESIYHKKVTEAKENLLKRMAIGGLLDFDKEANLKAAYVVKDFYDWAWDNLNVKNADPLAQVDLYYKQFVRSVLGSSIIVYESESMKKLLPPEVHDPESLAIWRSEHTGEQYHRDYLKYLEIMDIIRSLSIEEGISAESSKEFTESGRPKAHIKRK